jgi:hypothetical protein
MIFSENRYPLDVSFQEVVHSVLAEEAEVAEASGSNGENRMDIHKNAPLTPKGREAMVRIVIEGGMTKAAAAYQFNTTICANYRGHALRIHGVPDSHYGYL